MGNWSWTKSLQFKKDGSWTTVKKPWIKHLDVWRDVHHVWIKHGGTWRKVHKTPISEYSVVNTVTYYGNTSSNESGTYTVPAGVRYLKFTASAQGGGSGGAAGTGGWGAPGHYGCSGGTTNQAGGYHNHAAGSGSGGDGAYINVTIEVAPGDTFNWSITKVASNSTVKNSARMELNVNTAQGAIRGVGTSATGATGVDGGGVVNVNGVTTPGEAVYGADASGGFFAYDGKGGLGGKVQVTSNCTSGSGTGEPFGYEVSETTGANGADGYAQVSGQWIIVNNSSSSGGGLSGRPGVSNSYPEQNGDNNFSSLNTHPVYLRIEEYS